MKTKISGIVLYDEKVMDFRYGNHFFKKNRLLTLRCNLASSLVPAAIESDHMKPSYHCQT